MKKPDCEINELINHLQEKEGYSSHCFSKGTTYYLKTSTSVALLHYGAISFYRGEDNKFLFQLQAPFVIGLTKLMTLNENYYVKCDTDIELSFIDNNIAFEIIENNNLWKISLKTICYLIYINESSVFSGANAYDIIRKSLNELWQLPKSERENISVFDYTMKKYSISRSSIAKILKALNDGLYIKTKRGVLIELNKLPEKY